LSLVEQEPMWTRGRSSVSVGFYCSMLAMFMKVSFVLIFVERSLERCAIWLCMYWRNVMDVQRPCFWMVVSETPCSFRAMAPPARSECTPTRSGSMPFLSSSKALTDARTAFRIWVEVTENHFPLSSMKSQSRLSAVPPFVSTW